MRGAPRTGSGSADEAKSVGLREQANQIEQAWHGEFDPPRPAMEMGPRWAYVRDVTDDQLIVEEDSRLYSYAYARGLDGAITFGEAVEVRIEYVPVEGTSTPTGSGSAKAIGKRKDVTAADRKRALTEYGNVQFADEKNKKYALDTEAHIRAAWSYINQEKNAAKYDADEVTAIKRRIVGAWKKKIDKEGPPAAGKSLAIKALSEDELGCTVGGYLVLWGGPKAKDLQGDWFTPATELMLEHYKTAPALFHHGLDGAVGGVVIGRRLSAAKDETGVWVEDWLDKSNRYWNMVEPLLKAERLFYSPGSAPHMVKRADDKPGELVRFPVVEDTLTPVPAQYRLRPIEEIKAAYKSASIDMPEVGSAADGGPSGVEALKARVEVEELLIELEGSGG